MPLTICPECKTEISDKAIICPKCGAPQVKQKSSAWKWVIGVPAGLFLAMMVFGFFSSKDPSYEKKLKASKAIEFCWQDQSRKSLDPSSARFVASVCEKMELEFITKFGHKP